MIAWPHFLICAVMVCGDQPPTPPPAPQVIPQQGGAAIPLPAGNPGSAGHYIRTERTPSGSVVYHGYRNESGVCSEHAIKGGTRFILPLFEMDYSRTNLLVGWHQAVNGLFGLGAQCEVFIANRWTAQFEIETTLAGPRVSLRGIYNPIPGVCYGVGIDSSLGVLLDLSLYF